MMLKTKLLITSVMATVLTGCCLVDYTKIIKKVAEPMFEELESFYKEHKRYPNLEEQEKMYKKAGCKMKGNICTFKGSNLTITRIEKTYVGDYRIIIQVIDKNEINIHKQSLADCRFGVYKDGTLNSVGCTKRPCIELRQ